MKISKKVYIHIKYTFISEMTTGLYNSLNPRPELLAGADDDFPVNVGPYIHYLRLEEGQGVMWAFIDLSFNFAPNKII
jgi:hypothetical protein